MAQYNLIQGDCLAEMDKLIEQGITVDAIITDPPYGTLNAKWDSVIPFDEMWLRLNKLIKPNGAIVLFGSEPFSSALRMSNVKNYKYDWVWVKERGTGVGNARKMPMKKHELISVFYKKQPIYHYQGEPYEKPIRHLLPIIDSVSGGLSGASSINNKERKVVYYTHRTKNSVLNFNRESNRKKYTFHPTQKPVALMEYLIKTYTNEGETVLDFTMGSGTTGVAAKILNRQFIGIELDDKYFEIAKDRVEDEN